MCKRSKIPTDRPIYKQHILEVICGSMFSGKSEELIRRVKRAKYAKQNVVVFKHASDMRYDLTKVSSHNKNMIEAIPVNTPENIIKCVRHYELTGEVHVVAIDEVQFFDESIVSVIKQLTFEGKRVIVAGLDQDFRGEPFTFMGYLMAIADYVDKLHAICVVCGKEASRTQRIIDGKPANINEPIVLVGSEENYEARCSKCHELNIK